MNYEEKAAKTLISSEFTSYNDYLRKEWSKFEAEKERYHALLDSIGEQRVERVLDIGCGAGQEMLPFIEEKGAIGVGMDVTPFVGEVGYEMFASKGLRDKINFVNGSGNELPFREESFDILICRGALMFMNFQVAVKEMARVLKSGGKFFLKVQDRPYYVRRIKNGLKSGNFLTAIHSSRVILAGAWYGLTNNQSFGRLTAGGEMYNSYRALSAEMEKNGMQILREMPDTNALTPSFLIIKK